MLKYNPLNERLKKQYEEGLIHGSYRDTRTVDAAWKAINMFEQFTGKKDFTTFDIEQAMGFKRWLTKQENAKGELLSLSTVRSILANVRDFFGWLAIHPLCIRKVDGRAATYLRLSDKAERAGRATRELPVPTFDEVHKALEAMPYDSDVEKRDRAIMAFMPFSGVRDAALISLKIKDIDIVEREIWQDPRHVKTKGSKGITTDFMSFDPLWEKIVLEWLDHAKNTLGFKGDDPLFPKQAVENNPEKMKFEAGGLSREHWANTAPIRQIFREAFTRVGIRYYNPHSVRKMISIWALDNCDQKQYKAISQNLGHEYAMTTYNAYGTLNRHDRRKAIASVGQCNADLKNISDEDFFEEMRRRMKK